jgi:Zn-dependent peptidase ImmA (M78 family)
MKSADPVIASTVQWIHGELQYYDPPFSVSNVMERLFPEIDVVGRDMDPYATIEVYPRGLPNGTKAVIAYREQSHHSTQRFSIGHELGHWLLDFGRGSRLEEGGCNGHKGREKRADAFALELLAPLWVLDRFVDFEVHPDKTDADAMARRNQRIQRLASRFNLSLRCMRLRVFELHRTRNS